MRGVRKGSVQGEWTLKGGQERGRKGGGGEEARSGWVNGRMKVGVRCCEGEGETTTEGEGEVEGVMHT